MTTILIIAVGICGAGWILTRISLLSVLLFMAEKGYKLPDEEETKAYTRKAASELFRR
jgi:hypothetical protein